MHAQKRLTSQRLTQRIINIKFRLSIATICLSVCTSGTLLYWSRSKTQTNQKTRGTDCRWRDMRGGGIGEGGFEGIYFSLCLETKHQYFTVPPTVALLKHMRSWNTFVDFPKRIFSAVYTYSYIMKRVAAKLRWAGGAQRSVLRG